jgi:hypothetical protein
VTGFRPGFAVHGRFRLPCPECGAPIQRIVKAENETDYCRLADHLDADQRATVERAFTAIAR